MRERLDAALAAHAWVCEHLLDVQQLVTDAFRQPAGPAAAPAQEARVLLHRLGCLSLALDRLVDDVDAVDRSTGAGEEALARLLAAPCEVRFTAATGEPVTVEAMTVQEILVAAREHVAGIRRIVEAYGRDRLTVRARRLRSSVERLRQLATEAAAEGLGDGADPLAALAVDGLLDRLAAAEAAGRGRWWRGDVRPERDDGALEAAVDRAVEQVDTARRRLRRGCHAELTGRLEAYRQRAADVGRAEHPEVERAYREAVAALRPDVFAVTDASRAVQAYQRAVNGGTP
ncbi:hypothetical protein GA0070606_5960 [Micromonospora citrea]|uniref:Uncharacterized protein n=1 Tax=Micromonospora citrea TaxID=47855 RepID=A0A1C6W0R4_9ACTN|nr:hypothetical protein [Micromonospora citrea]SCL72116.1 hypothetical protein GA0070606_5960 [Micromonospora citrea]